MVTQIWVGGTDLAGMLCDIGGWWVDCQNEHQAQEAVNHARHCGYIIQRTHYSPSNPKGDPAWEVTDAGIEVLRKWWGDKAAANALKMRQWYRDRDHTSKPGVA